MRNKMSFCIILFLSLVFVNEVKGQNAYRSVWQIGKNDKSAQEFALYDAKYKDFATTYKDGAIIYEVGTNKDSDFPFFLPGLNDSWAGNTNQVFIRFGLGEVQGNTTAKLRINILETHTLSPLLEVNVNGYSVKVQSPKGNNNGFLSDKKINSKDLFVEVAIPANVLKQGDNTLVIRNEYGSWLAFDNIELSADKSVVLAKPTKSVTLFGTTAIPALIYGKNKELRQPLKLYVVNWDNKPQTVSVKMEGVPTANYKLNKGVNTLEMTVPEATADKNVLAEIVSKSKVVDATTIKLAPIKKWTMYLVQHTHTDIGYTKPQTEILTEHLRYIDYAIEYCELTENYPDDAKFRWTCEAAWAVREYLHNRPQEQINKLKKYIDNGQIEVAAMFFNMSEIVDENSFKTFLEPIREFKKRDIPVYTAMQNDVNGIAWCLADYLPDLGVKYVWMGEHGHRALIPFDKPTVFRWESPSGKPIYTYRADHYNTGNFFGIEHGDADKIAPRVFYYLQNLDNRDYPFDAVGVQYSGYFTDNSPPSMVESRLIRDWNEKYAYPKLRSSLAHEFMDYVTENYKDKIETQRVAYPDWWTDGFGSAARETGASRKTHSDLIAVEGLLSMARLKGLLLPAQTHEKIRRIHENILFYDEHTFGAAESISDPMAENSQIQWAEKSAYVWDALKNTQMLYETSGGILQGDLMRGKNPTITFFNTLSWMRSEMIVMYIDHEVIPRDKPFKLIDKDGKALKTQPIRSRNEGTYYAIYAEDIPAMGYNTYEIVEDKTLAPKLSAAKKPSVIDDIAIGVLENEFYKLVVDPDKGAIVSLYDKQLNKEMVDTDSEWGLGEFIYEKLDNRQQMERYVVTDYKRNGLTNCDVTMGANGAIYQTINISGKSGCCEEKFGVKIEVRLFHNTKRIELAYAMKRLPETDPTAIYVAFPFKLDNSKLAFDVQGGILTAGENQLTGTSTSWNTVQNFVTARNDKAQFIVGSDIVPLVQLGSILTGPFQYKKEYEKPHVFSYVMNNYWTTNFRASQEGEFRWSYYLTSSDDTSNTKATKFGWSSRVPLYARVMPVGKDNGKAADYSAFHINKENFLMTSSTPSIEDGYILINVRELDGVESNFSILDRNGNPLTFSIVNAIEEVEQSGLKEFKFKPFENKFIRLKL